MTNSIKSLIESGTKLYLDSVEPSEVDQNLAWGAVGATSNPAIISGIVKAGGLDSEIESLIGDGHDDETIAWELTDSLVKDAQKKFLAIHEQTGGDAGWVSFELDPLLEDPSLNLSEDEVVNRYIELGKKWAAGHVNRMIKVPATAAGLRALEPMAAAGITLNVTLIFTKDQYLAAREAVWKGAQKLANRDQFKSVYSIFISRIDVYTKSQVPTLSDEAQGMVGLLNAKRVWQENTAFWADKKLPLAQELIFASTGTKNPSDLPYRYVQALAGSDIQTNPPETNQAVVDSGVTFTRTVDQMPSQSIQDDIDAKVDVAAMRAALMAEGVDKFVKPQRALLELIATKRKQLSPSS
ncbi:transaldolase family protein [Rubripirellula reticaptiva]|uniref:Transaldolase n=1 Tax=Rubripirellula reticaptiva TaxID=2528013 RepID=A0A5C6EQW9_9BACT|nr:transaldolase family protein [Rubripirellula reticaptiva]TWU49809.1 Transaldolase [Rubripirellula reticaptiva]